MLQVVGQTEDGKPVVAGVFRLEDTEGIPLHVSLDYLNESGFMPDWTDFYIEARKNGWKHKTIVRKLGEAIEEIYGGKFRDVVIERLESYALSSVCS